MRDGRALPLLGAQETDQELISRSRIHFLDRLRNCFIAEVTVLKAQMRGAIEADFNDEFMRGPETLIWEELKVLILETQGKVVGQGPFGSHA